MYILGVSIDHFFLSVFLSVWMLTFSLRLWIKDWIEIKKKKGC